MSKEIFTKSEKFKQEYSATIVKVGELKDIENSDNLKQVIIDGFSVVVNKNDVKEGDLMIYCKNETELCSSFLSVNNMYEIGEKERNANFAEVSALLAEGKTDEAKALTGYFNKHGRVKMIKLRGCPSMGVLMRLESFINWDESLKDVNLSDYIKYDENGNFIPFDFDTVNDRLFIKAYVPKTNPVRSGGGSGPKKDKTKKFDRMIEETNTRTQQVKTATQEAEIAAAQAQKLVKQAEAEKQAAELNAKAMIAKAQGEAEAKKIVADANAYEAKKIAENQQAFQKQWDYEINLERAKRWNGKEVPDSAYVVPGTGAVVPLTTK